MRITVFAPHPDDEIFGCGGSILKWLDDGHRVEIIYVTDNRALISWGKKENQLLEKEAQKFLSLTNEEIGEIAIEEARKAARDFGIPDNNVHFFEFPDQEAELHIKKAIKLSKKIISNSERIVLPSDNNNHMDHQATHEIAKNSAKELGLIDAEFYIYAIYNVLKVPKEKQIKIKISDYRERLYEIMKNYKTQLCLKDTRVGWKTLKRKRTERFGVFSFKDMNKFENF